MSVLTAPPILPPSASNTPPPSGPVASSGTLSNLSFLRRFTVDEYHRLIENGIVNEADPVELLEGFLVLKMPRTPQHDGPMDLFEGAVEGKIPAGWFLRVQRAITLADSEPEPDYAVVRGSRRDYLTHHPRPENIGLVVEMSRSSLLRDSVDKVRIYARAGIPVYWIVNLVERKIEVFTQPSGPTEQPVYARREEFLLGQTAPIVLDGLEVGRFSVAETMP